MRPVRLLTAASLVGLSSLVVGCVPRQSPAEPATGASADAPAAATAELLSIADVAERVLPSVVSVASSRRGALPPWHPRARRGGELQEGLGSGVVVAEGVIVTNLHVVDGAEKIRVSTNDGQEFDAEVVGSDELSDIAVLRPVPTGVRLVPLPVGDSAALRLGEVVLAVGNPFGVGQTVTMGIVSAKDRADVGIVAYEDFIQTDAAINPGNSGGALVNLRGELVGINTAILSRSGGSQGIGFAIPSTMVMPIVEALLSSGQVSRGWLGIHIQDVDAALAEALALPSVHGVLVADVSGGSPAEAAGLRRGDVVLAVNGQATDSAGQLRNRIAAAGAGGSARLTVFRGGVEVELVVALGAAPGSSMPAKPPPRAERAEPAPPAGTRVGPLTVAPLTAESRKTFGVVDEVTHGVVVVAVEPASALAAAGVAPGDVLAEVDQHKIDTPEELAERWKVAAPRGKRLLLVHRGRRSIYVAVAQ